MEHRIRERAYFIWQTTGSLDELANWLEAERQICEEEAGLKSTAKKKTASAPSEPPAKKVAAPLKTALKKAGLGSKTKKK